MRRGLVVMMTVMTVALLGAACSDDGSGDDSGGNGGGGGSSGATPLVGTNWVLSDRTDLGVPVEGVTVSALFTTRQVSGESGCNTYRGPYERDGSALTIGPDLATTLIGCDDPQASVERVYLQRLTRVRSFAISGEQLTLRDGDGDAILVYRASGADDLVGSWIVTSYYSGDAVRGVVLGTELTADFTASEVSGNAGCNQFGGQVETSGDRITISSVFSTLRGCVDPEVTQQEADYLAALELASTFRVTGDRLDLYRPDGGFAVTFTRA